MDSKDIARVAHEATRVLHESMGDRSYAMWHDTSEWHQETTIQAVEFLANNPGANMAALHDNWLNNMRAAGWSHGPVFDARGKAHPHFRPYGELPDVYRYDGLMLITVVRACAGEPIPVATHQSVFGGTDQIAVSGTGEDFHAAVTAPEAGPSDEPADVPPDAPPASPSGRAPDENLAPPPPPPAPDNTIPTPPA